jgi:hypothetical protein
MERDFGFAPPLDDPFLQAINHVSVAPVADAALHHLQTWVRDRTPPPLQRPIEFAGSPPQIERDADRIAKNGVRLPQVEVPLAHNSAIQRTPDVFARLVGTYEAFPAEEVRGRYGSREGYLARYEDAARAAVAAGVVLPRDVEAMLAEAAAAFPF